MNAQTGTIPACAVCGSEADYSGAEGYRCHRHKETAAPENPAAPPHVAKGRNELHRPLVQAVADPSRNPSPNPQDTPVPEPASGLGSEGPDIEVYLPMFRQGEIQPEPVLLPPLPKAATENMRRVAEFYAQVRGIRLAVDDDEPVPFGGEWVANNLPGRPRVTGRTVSRALHKLVVGGVLERGDDMRTTKGRLVFTYLPGSQREENPK